MPAKWSVVLLASFLAPPGASFDERESVFEERLYAGLEHGFPGLALLIDEPGEPLWVGAAGYADILEETELTESALFHLASVSKIFTAVATLRLIDAGELELGARVVEVLPPEVLAGLHHIEAITIEQLLDHTSGLYSFNNEEAYWDTLIGARALDGVQWSFEELLSFAKDPANVPLGSPGQEAHYSDTNYVLLALVVQEVSGEPFKAHVTRTIFEPLGMSSTGFLSDGVPGDGASGLVEGYDVLSDVLVPERYHESFSRISDHWGVEGTLVQSTAGRERNDAAAGVVGSVRDLHAFARALFDGELLGPDTLAWLTSVADELGDVPVGTDRQAVMRAIRIPQGLLLTLHGDGPGTNTLLAQDRESGTIVIAMTNIFGLWTEHEFMRRGLVGAVLARER